MAKARMLHTSISRSSQVNSLSLPAKILFTWMIAHADDEGRLKGNPLYIKATVVPMTNWSGKKIEIYLKEIKNAGLIHYWKQENGEFIEYINWKDYQTIRKDRFTSSKLPSFKGVNDNQQTTVLQPKDNQTTAQYNRSEYNLRKENISESSKEETIADNKTLQKIQLINPKDFQPSTEGEVAALEAWQKLEPHNPLALQTTYLKAMTNGLPVNLFYQFVSEILQDKTIENKGAVFNKKVLEYFSKK